MLLRRGKKKVQSSHMVDSGVLKAALAKATQKGEMVTRKRPVIKTILIVTLLSCLQKNVVRWVKGIVPQLFSIDQILYFG